MVLDHYQGQGIATMIMKHLLLIARESGIAQFEAEVLIENAKMLAVFTRTGLPMTKSREGAVFHVTMDLSSKCHGIYAMKGPEWENSWST